MMAAALLALASSPGLAGPTVHKEVVAVAALLAPLPAHAQESPPGPRTSWTCTLATRERFCMR